MPNKKTAAYMAGYRNILTKLAVSDAWVRALGYRGGMARADEGFDLWKDFRSVPLRHPVRSPGGNTTPKPVPPDTDKRRALAAAVSQGERDARRLQADAVQDLARGTPGRW